MRRGGQFTITSLNSKEMASLENRIWSKVDATGDCWEWTAGKNQGYGKVTAGKMSRLAHRVVYELLVGPIPPGMDYDHLCRNRGCVNPDHAEIVAPVINTLRGTSPAARHARATHCLRGHRFDETNTFLDNLGRRICRTCKRAHAKKLAERPGQKEKHAAYMREYHKRRAT